MFKNIKNNNIYFILLLVVLIFISCIYGSQNQYYIEGLNTSTSTGLIDYVSNSGDTHNSPSPPSLSPHSTTPSKPPPPPPAPSKPPPPTPAPSKPPPPPPAPAKVYPVCQMHEGTVWAMCGKQPISKWGCSNVEDQCKSDIGNCNYEATKCKKMGCVSII